MRHSQRRIIQALRGHLHIHPGGVEETRALCAAVGLGPGSRVLDLGFGFGGPLAWMEAERGWSVVGVDRERENARLARRETGLERARIVVADGGSLPLRSEVLDGVVCWCVLGFVAERDRFLSEVRRVLRPGGRFGLHAYTRLGPHRFRPRPGGMAHVAPLGELRRALLHAGFSLLEERSLDEEYRRYYDAFWKEAQGRRAELEARFGKEAVDDALGHFLLNVRQVTERTKGGVRFVAARGGGADAGGDA